MGSYLNRLSLQIDYLKVSLDISSKEIIDRNKCEYVQVNYLNVSGVLFFTSTYFYETI